MSKQSIILEFSYQSDSVWLALEDWPTALELVTQTQIQPQLGARTQLIIYCYQWLASRLTPLYFLTWDENISPEQGKAKLWFQCPLSPLVNISLGLTNADLWPVIEYQLKLGGYLQLEAITPFTTSGKLQLAEQEIGWQILTKAYLTNGSSPWLRVDFNYQEQIASAYLSAEAMQKWNSTAFANCQKSSDKVQQLISELNQYLSNQGVSLVNLINILPSCKLPAGTYWPLELNCNQDYLVILLSKWSFFSSLANSIQAVELSSSLLAKQQLTFQLIHGRSKLSATEAANLSPGDVILFDQPLAPDYCAINFQRLDLIFQQTAPQQLTYQQWQSCQEL